MNRGCLALSPSACRSSRTQTFRATSLTAVSGQTASNKASLVNNWPGCSTKQRRTAKVLGRRGSGCARRHNRSLARSRRKGGKNTERSKDTAYSPPVIEPKLKGDRTKIEPFLSVFQVES